MKEFFVIALNSWVSGHSEAITGITYVCDEATPDRNSFGDERWIDKNRGLSECEAVTKAKHFRTDEEAQKFAADYVPYQFNFRIDKWHQRIRPETA